MFRCMLCRSSETDEVNYGEVLGNEIQVHTFCLYLSSNLCQAGNEGEGLLGFLQDDIIKEARRVSRLLCCYCSKSYANIGCCNTKCRRCFHLECGIKHGAEYEFIDTYNSYCNRHVQKKSGGKPKRNEKCCICCEYLRKPRQSFSAVNMLQAPCCKHGWFHKVCLQKFAKTAGYFFKCPLCNDKKIFCKMLPYKGIFIYDSDAAWELEPNAFADQLERPNSCAASTCQCWAGRQKNIKINPLLLCTGCGSVAMHKKCLPASILGNKFYCNDCNIGQNGTGEKLHMIKPDENYEDEDVDVCNESVENDSLDRRRIAEIMISSSSEDIILRLNAYRRMNRIDDDDNKFTECSYNQQSRTQNTKINELKDHRDIKNKSIVQTINLSDDNDHKDQDNDIYYKNYMDDYCNEARSSIIYISDEDNDCLHKSSTLSKRRRVSNNASNNTRDSSCSSDHFPNFRPLNVDLKADDKKFISDPVRPRPKFVPNITDDVGSCNSSSINNASCIANRTRRKSMHSYSDTEKTALTHYSPKSHTKQNITNNISCIANRTRRKSIHNYSDTQKTDLAHYFPKSHTMQNITNNNTSCIANRTRRKSFYMETASEKTAVSSSSTGGHISSMVTTCIAQLNDDNKFTECSYSQQSRTQNTKINELKDHRDIKNKSIVQTINLSDDNDHKAQDNDIYYKNYMDDYCNEARSSIIYISDEDNDCLHKSSTLSKRRRVSNNASNNSRDSSCSSDHFPNFRPLNVDLKADDKKFIYDPVRPSPKFVPNITNDVDSCNSSSINNTSCIANRTRRKSMHSYSDTEKTALTHYSPKSHTKQHITNNTSCIANRTRRKSIYMETATDKTAVSSSLTGGHINCMVTTCIAQLNDDNKFTECSYSQQSRTQNTKINELKEHRDIKNDSIVEIINFSDDNDHIAQDNDIYYKNYMDDYYNEALSSNSNIYISNEDDDCLDNNSVLSKRRRISSDEFCNSNDSSCSSVYFHNFRPLNVDLKADDKKYTYDPVSGRLSPKFVQNIINDVDSFSSSSTNNTRRKSIHNYCDTEKTALTHYSPKSHTMQNITNNTSCIANRTRRKSIHNCSDTEKTALTHYSPKSQTMQNITSCIANRARRKSIHNCSDTEKTALTHYSPRSHTMQNITNNISYIANRTRRKSIHNYSDTQKTDLAHYSPKSHTMQNIANNTSCIANRTRRKSIYMETATDKTAVSSSSTSGQINAMVTTCIAQRTRRKSICVPSAGYETNTTASPNIIQPKLCANQEAVKAEKTDIFSKVSGNIERNRLNATSNVIEVKEDVRQAQVSSSSSDISSKTQFKSFSTTSSITTTTTKSSYKSVESSISSNETSTSAESYSSIFKNRVKVLVKRIPNSLASREKTSSKSGQLVRNLLSTNDDENDIKTKHTASENRLQRNFRLENAKCPMRLTQNNICAYLTPRFKRIDGRLKKVKYATRA